MIMDMPEAYSGGVIQELNRRKGMMLLMETLSTGFVRIKYEMPTRGLIGFRSFFLTETRGEGSMSGLFLGYRPYAGDFSGRTRGAIVSMEAGSTNAYALFSIQDRGDLFRRRSGAGLCRHGDWPARKRQRPRREPHSRERSKVTCARRAQTKRCASYRTRKCRSNSALTFSKKTRRSR
jgi:translation elongation factor EF-G